MKTHSIRLLVLGFGFALATHVPASAALVFTTTITHDQESGAPGVSPLLTSTGASRPLSYGTATFTLNDAMNALSFTATIYNIDVTGTQTTDPNDNLTNAHLHAGAPLGANAGVVFGFFGAPFNDNNPNNVAITPFASGVGGTFTSIWNAGEGNNTTLSAQLPNILGGSAYINFHTVQFGGGEIRGQIPGVPDSGSTAVLLVLGLASLVGLARRK